MASDTKATPTDVLLSGLDTMGLAYNQPPCGSRIGRLMVDAAKEIRKLRAERDAVFISDAKAMQERAADICEDEANHLRRDGCEEEASGAIGCARIVNAIDPTTLPRPA